MAPKVSKLYLNRVLLNARYMQSILKLSDTADATRFSPTDALHELITLNEETQLKRHLVSRLTLPAECQLTGNKLTFQEMLVCLINNAYESYEPKRHYKLVFLNAVQHDRSIKISVTDGGKGMNWLAQKLSVTPLYSTKQEHSGLGLYFVKKSLEQEFAGQLQLHSRLNQGTTVVLRFPLQRRHVVAKPAFGLQY
jgi:sensor histidine kinase regulating citrate/malate metabolism